MSNQLDAKTVHGRLCSALVVLRQAEGNAVALFAEVLRRRLFRALGFASIHIYAQEALGFSRSKTYEFIRLAEALGKLPGLKAKIESGELAWTKAREVVKVATPETEKQWLEMASEKSRRELEKEVVMSRARRDRSKSSRGQAELLKPDGKVPPEAAPVQALTLRFEAMQRARFDSMIEKLMKRFHCSREQALLMALESFVESGEESTRVDGGSTYQVIVKHCPACEIKSIGPEQRPLNGAESAQIDCDSKVLEPGRRNRQSIPPARRRAVLIRDGHRCRAKGCTSTSFLEVHHWRARSRGGDNSLGNLITLCSSCHRYLHERSGAVTLPENHCLEPRLPGSADSRSPIQIAD